MTTPPGPPAMAIAWRARVVGTAVAVGIGVAVSVQARINGELARRIDDGLLAALLSFLTGMVLLVLLAAVLPPMRAGLRRVRGAVADRRLRSYHLLGGIFGAFLVTSQGLTVAVIGVAVFTVAVVAGQVLSGLLVDRFGVGPGGAEAITIPRLSGAVLALVAVLLAVVDRLDTPSVGWLVLVPALAGVGVAWQQAVNGKVGAAARQGGHPLAGMLPAALVNFGVGTTALVLVTTVELSTRGWPEPLPTQPWLYLGGPLGVLFISAAAVIVPLTGVLLLGLGAVAGQLAGALLLDLFVPTGSAPLTVSTLVGVALALLAVSVTALPTRRGGGTGDARM